MPFVSVTRLRVRSWRFLPAFFLHARRTSRQASAAPGFRAGSLLPDRRWTFWTLTLWDRPEDMRAYIKAGDHKKAMPRLTHWCDEASIVHWEQPDLTLPSWPEADARMRREGRPSKVRNPTAEHLAIAFPRPRPGPGAPITPRPRA
jgi:heme-degrading monooxygenase HmoA